MEINGVDYIQRDELVYWIDKGFVQETAKDKIGRELTEEELRLVTKYMEFGLWESVFAVTKIAIDTALEEKA